MPTSLRTSRAIRRRRRASLSTVVASHSPVTADHRFFLAPLPPRAARDPGTLGHVAAIDELRTAELGFLDTGEERHLDRAEALVDGVLRSAPFALATRLWLSLLRYDRGSGDELLDTVVDACTPGANADASLDAAEVAALLRRWARDGQAVDLDRVICLSETARAGEPGPAGARDLPLWLSSAWRAIDLGAAYLERSRTGAASGPDDLRAARDALCHAVWAPPAPTVKALGLRHLAACEQELYVRRGGRRLLDQAIRRYQSALAMLPPRSVLRPMLLTELGTALQDRFAEDQELTDIDTAVSYAEQALAEATAAGASQPDLACHLVNFGTALSARYEQTGDRRDLDGAVRRWSEAVDELPAGSSYRPVFLDRLALGHAMRWEYGGGGEEDLDTAIDCGRSAVREGAEDPDAAVYASNLAGALEQRWELHRDPGDLHEAVRVFAVALARQPGNGASAAELTVNFAHTLLARYQALGGAPDLDTALAALGKIPGGGQRGAQRSSVAAVTARVLSMRYEAAGDPADLAAAIVTARRGLAGVPATSTTRNSRTARLAHLLYLRFARYGRRRDLDDAIGLLRGLADAPAAGSDGHEATPDQLSQLASYLSERYDRDGSLADRDAAIGYGRRARATDRRDEEPTVDSALASVLHDRFGAAGWLDDLDEVIGRYREALTRQAPTSPVYPAILNNLAIVLQDRYLYRDDSRALDEAVGLHELAVSTCPPRAPDRPGYLGTLAVAVRLRFERDGQEKDLDRAISLDEQALARLEPGAGERARLLGNLAQARHLRATRTGSPADFTAAVSDYRAALRRMRAGSPARPTVLSGYAQAAGEHPATPRRAVVLRAFREALAASAGAPLVSFDVAGSLAAGGAEPALARPPGLPDRGGRQARAVRRPARPCLRGRLAGARHGDERCRGGGVDPLGQPRLAAVALDAGRALALSEALDMRGAPGRLRAGNHGELADRYERAIGLLRQAATARPDDNTLR